MITLMVKKEVSIATILASIPSTTNGSLITRIKTAKIRFPKVELNNLSSIKGCIASLSLWKLYNARFSSLSNI